ncbi:MAG: hypothetical protein JW910_18395 [Anaerolineae bacterium]|nr:hypothetical protein [Anaerolineae bacterium]
MRTESNKPTKPFTQLLYGVSTEVFVVSKDDCTTYVMGGVGIEYGRWTRVLSKRAAQLLWFKLTRVLFPDRAQRVTTIAVTAPLRDLGAPAITNHIEVSRTADNFVEVLGWVEKHTTWWVRLPENEARTLWTRLDLALYPVGWEGRQNKRQQSAASDALVN